MELDIIHGQAVEASENVKEGNEQVRGVSLAMDIKLIKVIYDNMFMYSVFVQCTCTAVCFLLVGKVPHVQHLPGKVLL